MNLLERYFKFGSFESYDYGLRFVNIETARNMRLEGEYKSNYFFNRTNQTRHILKNQYEDSPLYLEAEILADDEMLGSFWRHSAIVEKALFSNREYVNLTYSNHDMVEGRDFVDNSKPVFDIPVEQYLDRGIPKLRCRFINAEVIEDSCRKVGYKFVIDCASDMPEVERQISLSSPSGQNTRVIVNNFNKEYVYPRMVLTVGSSGGNLQIKNISDSTSRTTEFVGLTPGSTLVIDGKNKEISSGALAKFSGRLFPRFIDGTNTLYINGDISNAKITWNEKVPMGFDYATANKATRG
jgi:hypothetical protein